MVINTESYNWSRCREYDTVEGSALNETDIYITPLLPRFSNLFWGKNENVTGTIGSGQLQRNNVVFGGWYIVGAVVYEFIAAETVCISPTHAHARKYSGMKWGGRY